MYTTNSKSTKRCHPPKVENPPENPAHLLLRPEVRAPWRNCLTTPRNVQQLGPVTLGMHVWHIYLHLIAFYGKCR